MTLEGKLLIRDNTIRELENENILLKEIIDDLAGSSHEEQTESECNKTRKYSSDMDLHT